MEESGGKGDGESFYMRSKLCGHFAEWWGKLIYISSNYFSICAKSLLLGKHLSYLFPT